MNNRLNNQPQAIARRIENLNRNDTNAALEAIAREIVAWMEQEDREDPNQYTEFEIMHTLSSYGIIETS